VSADLIVLVSGIAVAAICVAVGAIRVVAVFRLLRARVDAYRDLPLLRLAETTRTRVSAAQLSVREAPALRTRAITAASAFFAACDSVAESALTVYGTLRALPSLLLGHAR